MLKVKEHIRGIAWRRVLCVTQLVLAVALLAVGDAQYQVKGSLIMSYFGDVNDPKMLALKKDLKRWSGPHSIYSKVLFGINFPAFLVSAPLFLLYAFLSLKAPENVWVDPLGMVFLILFLFLVGAFWYWVGWGLDRKLGSIPSPPLRTPTRLWIAAHEWGFLGCAASLALVVYGLVFAPRILWITIMLSAIALWSGIGAFYLLMKLHRNRSAGKEKN